MPKKFQGENSKAVAARARKSAAKEQQHAQKQKQLEDQYWQDDDKHVARKQQRKDEQERKKQVAADRKAESKALLEQEMSTIKKPTKAAPPPKITRAQVSENISNVNVVKKEEKKIETHLDVPLEENLNRMTIDGEEARTVTEAISLLSNKPQDVDKHPEKRMKAAYAAFEENRLQVLKEEQPTLRLSQLKQLIFREWQKSPENPLNCRE
ncbi:hypothetical protein ILUMI_23073 [Ignelater luminosus]|uniref:Coiled-coil domain-containing protein n=1 Tax=Ignelater luminosus TaxID=2038154 RepID=A0A8K0CCP4_IGNLU|nr:hypothetical protein ILUMI_23073 [Ignelater luminosus]